jgi:hypothetical protein
MTPTSLPLAAPAAEPIHALPAAPVGSTDLFARSLRDASSQQGSVDVMAQRIATAIDGFRGRAEGIGTDVARIMGTPAAAPAGTPAVVGPDGDLRRMYGLVVRTFDFAMETHLVAKAATQFTGSINTLVKGQ